MTINPNMINIIQMMKNGGNPQQMVMEMMQQQSKNNPFMANLLQLAQSNNAKGIEEIARNMMAEKGLDFDTEFNSFKNNLGL